MTPMSEPAVPADTSKPSRRLVAGIAVFVVAFAAAGYAWLGHPEGWSVAPGREAVTGRVELAPALAAQAAPDDTVFIFARPAEGARMPLAILKRKVRDLPLDFHLDDSLAMSPAARLSGATRVVVGARVSKSGQAMPQPGDLEGLSAPVAPGQQGLKIVIGEVLP